MSEPWRIKIRRWCRFEAAAAVLAAAGAAGSASAATPPPPPPASTAHSSGVFAALHEPPAATPVEDPIERVNRRLFHIDLWVNKHLAGRGRILPLAIWIPRPLRHGLYNVFDNLEQPATIANDLMQLKFGKGVESAGRFGVNSTVGAFGVFDPATKMKLARTREDFGQTLATWGITAGPYVYIPISGPTTVRDSLGGLVDSFFLPDHWLPLSIWEDQGINLVHFVVKPATINIRQVARGAAEAGDTKDEYATLRQLYYDQRADQIADRPNLADDPVPEPEN
jgi:phospholipid-binding lipoprotein MlaA